MKSILFVRHGDTSFNAEKKFRGLQDVGLNGDGILEAMKLRDKYGANLSQIYASDLTRAQQTAKILGGGTVPVQTLPELRPWDVGAFAGQPKNDENVRRITALARTNGTPAGGEPISSFKRRYHAGLSAVLDHAQDLPDGGMMAVISHASNVHELSHILYGDPDAVKVEPGGVVGVGYDPEWGEMRAGVLEKPAPAHQQTS